MKNFKKSSVGLLIVGLILVSGLASLVQNAYAAASNAATNTELTPGSQFTTFVGVPVYRLHVANSGDAPDAITSLSPTPSGSVVDTTVTLHFFHDVNDNGIVDQDDIALGADAAFGADNTIQAFDITDVTVPAAGSASILITADIAAGVNAETFNLSFAAGADILMTVEPSGTFPMLNDAALTVSNVAPAVTIDDGAADPAAKKAKASATNVAVKQLSVTAAAGTSDSLVSLAPTPSGTENDNTNITSVVFYIDSGSVPGQVDGTDVQLETTPATYSADNTKTAFTFSSPVQITAGTSFDILVVYNLGAGVTNGLNLKTIIAAAGDVVAGSGTAVTQSSITSATITIDTILPTLDFAFTRESDDNGFIDSVQLFFSESLDDATIDANGSDFTITGCNVGAATRTVTNAVDGGTVTLTLTEDATLDTGVLCDVNIVGTLNDLAGNAVALTSFAITDGAQPSMATATYLDLDADGTVDTIRTGWSEDVTLQGSSITDWIITGGDINAVYASAPDDLILGPTLDVTITADADETGGVVDPTIAYDDSNFTVCDIEFNCSVSSVVPITVTDAAAPAFLSSTSDDTNTDGTVDQVTLVYSESVAITDAGVGFDGVAFSDSCVAADVDYTSAGTTTSVVALTSCTADDTSITVDPTYTAAAGQIEDLAAAPNEMANAETVTGTDGAAPQPISAEYLDTNADGTIDRVDILMTEVPILAEDEPDWTFPVAGDITLVTTGAGVGGSEVQLGVDADALETGVNGGTEPTVLYTNGSLADSLQDAAGNITATWSGAVPVTDAAAPFLRTDGAFAPNYFDLSGDGSVDRVSLIFTENVTLAYVDANWTVTANGLTSLDVTALNSGGVGVDTQIILTATAAASLTGVSGGTEPTIAFAHGTNLNDGNGNNLIAILATTLEDQASPVIVSRTTRDGDTDGKIDSIEVTLTEDVDDATLGAGAGGWELAGYTGEAVSTGAVATDALIRITFTEGAAADTGAVPTLAYTPGTLDDSAAATNALGASGATATTDNAAPVVMTVSPADTTTSVARDTTLVITFSEAMDTTFDEATEFAVAPDPGTFTEVWTVGDTVVTLTLDTTWTPSQLFTVTTAEAVIDAAAGGTTALVTTGPSDGDWSFTTRSSGSGGSGGGGGGGITVTSTTCTLTSPNGGETYTGGEPTNITWSSTGTGIDNVALFYSVDDGLNWGVIAAPETNDGTYTWNVANTATSQARVRVDCRDSGGGTLSSDQSNTAFTIRLTGELPVAPAPTSSGIMTRESANAVLPTGYLVDYLVKLPNDGNPDTWSDSTVYYLGLDAKRHPFPSANIYFTWYADFNDVRVIDLATIAQIPLGTPVLVRPGTSWVKIQSTVETYWVEPGSYVLRWIKDEATARALGGDNWNQNILDIEPTYFARFTMGSPIDLAGIATDWPEGALVKSPTDALIWYVTETGRRQITSTDAMNANEFQSRFVETNNAAGWQALPTETSITGFEDGLFSLQH